MEGLCDHQPWEDRAQELQNIVREIAREIEQWAKGERDDELALLAFVVEILVAKRDWLRAQHPDEWPAPLQLELQLLKLRSTIAQTSRNPAEADYLLGLLLVAELMRSALDLLFRTWREQRRSQQAPEAAPVREGGHV
ncbi:hypothetical protein HY442_00680 [Candidatus Parcubacteria bacterium]|nr:hypothetical protein [Candidatus Parcubacteria bacterium]